MFVTANRSLALLLLLAVASIACGSKSPSEPAPTPCAYALSPSSLSFDASGGSGSVTVTTAANCAWTAASDRAWMSIPGGTGSTGTGVVSVTVSANTGTSRGGTLTIAGQAVAVTQAGAAACTYEIAPASAAFNKDGGSGSITVTAPGGCAWTAATGDGWIAVTVPGTEPAGNGTVLYTVARNTQLGARAGAITIAGRRFDVMQSGDAGLCEYRVSPVDVSPCMAASQITTSIVTEATCPWTVAPDAGWMTVAGGTSGTGSATIRVNVSENWEAPRSGVLMVRWPTPTAGQNVRVSQAGCRYAVSVSDIAVAAAGGAARFDVYQQSEPYTCGGPLQNGCLWAAQADVAWIVVNTTMPQVGDNPVSLTIAANEGSAARAGNVRVRDRIVRVTQAGK